MIIANDPPAASTAIIARELAWAIGSRSLAGLIGRPVDPSAVTVTLPHPYAVLSIDDLRNTIAPVVAGWRYLIEVDGEVMARAATSLRNGQHRFGGLSAGRPVVDTASVAEFVDTQLAGDPAPSTLAVDEVLALHVSLLQVTNAHGAPQAFAVIGPDPSLGPNQLYDDDEIRRVLLQRVDRALRAPATVRPEPFGT